MFNEFSIFSEFSHSTNKKKKKLADKILPQKVRDLVPESQAYMDLLAFERKLDSTIMRKRLDIQVSPVLG
jgi:SWI/SNF-related matrix-associated actin-dependent regulator of chromatin subfamily D